MTSSILPVIKAIYLCDEVLEDRDNRKVHLLGVFNAVRPRGLMAYPHNLRRLCVFAQLVGGLGDVATRVEIVRASGDDVIYSTPDHPLRFPGRQTIVSACFRILDCSFPEPGVYLVELYCHNTIVDDRVLHLLPPEEAQP